MQPAYKAHNMEKIGAPKKPEVLLSLLLLL